MFYQEIINSRRQALNSEIENIKTINKNREFHHVGFSLRASTIIHNTIMIDKQFINLFGTIFDSNASNKDSFRNLSVQLLNNLYDFLYFPSNKEYQICVLDSFKDYVNNTCNLINQLIKSYVEKLYNTLKNIIRLAKKLKKDKKCSQERTLNIIEMIQEFGQHLLEFFNNFPINQKFPITLNVLRLCSHTYLLYLESHAEVTIDYILKKLSVLNVILSDLMITNKNTVFLWNEPETISNMLVKVGSNRFYVQPILQKFFQKDQSSNYFLMLEGILFIFQNENSFYYSDEFKNDLMFLKEKALQNIQFHNNKDNPQELQEILEALIKKIQFLVYKRLYKNLQNTFYYVDLLIRNIKNNSINDNLIKKINQHMAYIKETCILFGTINQDNLISLRLMIKFKKMRLIVKKIKCVHNILQNPSIVLDFGEEDNEYCINSLFNHFSIYFQELLKDLHQFHVPKTEYFKILVNKMNIKMKKLNNVANFINVIKFRNFMVYFLYFLKDCIGIQIPEENISKIFDIYRDMDYLIRKVASNQDGCNSSEIEECSEKIIFNVNEFYLFFSDHSNNLNDVSIITDGSIKLKIEMNDDQEVITINNIICKKGSMDSIKILVIDELGERIIHVKNFNHDQYEYIMKFLQTVPINTCVIVCGKLKILNVQEDFKNYLQLINSSLLQKYVSDVEYCYLVGYVDRYHLFHWVRERFYNESTLIEENIKVPLDFLNLFKFEAKVKSVNQGFTEKKINSIKLNSLQLLDVTYEFNPIILDSHLENQAIAFCSVLDSDINSCKPSKYLNIDEVFEITKNSNLYDILSVYFPYGVGSLNVENEGIFKHVFGFYPENNTYPISILIKGSLKTQLDNQSIKVIYDFSNISDSQSFVHYLRVKEDKLQFIPGLSANNTKKNDEEEKTINSIVKKISLEPTPYLDDLAKQFQTTQNDFINQMIYYTSRYETHEISSLQESNENPSTIIECAKKLSVLVSYLVAFSQGHGPLKTDQDIMNNCHAIKEVGELLVQMSLTVEDACKKGTTKTEIKAECNQIPLFLQQIVTISHIKFKTPKEFKINASEKIINMISSMIVAATNLMKNTLSLVKLTQSAHTQYKLQLKVVLPPLRKDDYFKDYSKTVSSLKDKVQDWQKII